MNKWNLILFLCASCVLSQNASSSDLWSLDINKNGIKVYTRNVAGSDFKEFRGVARIEASIDELIDIFLDVDNYSKWFGYTEKSKILLKTDKNQYIYIETDFLWPYANRDMAYKMEINRSIPNKLELLLIGLPDYIPTQKGLVRMEQANGRIVLTAKGNATEIIYEYHSEPGNNVPVWLAHKIMSQLPYTTLTGLRKLLEDKR